MMQRYRLLAACITSLHFFYITTTLYDRIQSQKAVLENLIDPTEKSIVLNKVIENFTDTLKKSAPKKVYDALHNISITDVQITDGAPGFKQGFTLSGTTNFFGLSTPITIYCVDNNLDSIGYILEIPLTDAWQFSDISPVLSKLDTVQFSSLRLIITSFTYLDHESGAPVRVLGLNVVGWVSLDNQFLDVIKKLIKGLGIQTQRQNQLSAAIYLPPIPKDTTFYVLFPLKIAVDFEELYEAKKIKTRPLLIKSIQFIDPIFSIFPLTLDIGLHGGINLHLTTQEEPIFLGLMTKVNPNKITIIGVMEGTYKSAFGLDWLELEKLRLGLEWDFALMALAAGTVPFTGIDLGGIMTLGEGADKTSVELRALITTRSDDFPQVGFLGKISQINFNAFFDLAHRVAKSSKLSIKTPNLPSIKLTDLELRFMPTYAGGTYTSLLPTASPGISKGFTAKGKIDIAGLKGGIHLELTLPTLPLNFVFECKAKGWLDPINRGFFTLVSAQDPNKGAFIDIGAGISTSPHAIISGLFAIPFLGFNHAVDFSITTQGLTASVESAVFFSTLSAKVSMMLPFNNFDNFLMNYECRSTILNSIKSAALGQIKSWQDSIQKRFDEKRNRLWREIQQKKVELKAMENDLKEAKEKCEHPSQFGGRIKSCPIYAAKLVAYEFEDFKRNFDKLTVQLSELFKLERIPKAILDAAGGFIDVTTILEINRIYGHITGKDIKALKTPLVNVDVIINLAGKKRKVTLNNVQFDFKNPLDSAKTVAQKIIEFLTA